MEPSMRTFLLLALTLVAIDGSKQSPLMETILLGETIEEVVKIQQNHSMKILNEYVEDIFPNGRCSKETLCQAVKVLKNTHLNHTKLHRNLYSYAKNTRHLNCNVTTTVRHPMKEFLIKIKKCCQLQIINVK